ncbi:response regulator transcription factor [Paenibacillus sambharensis]|uniref:response regulator transcription factor n=1 Tax=Paenibacillus sambharensis TaxID=1803190 RepID=UPI001FE80EAD|nr:response regulator [Paenibacillus sambharensis]
MEQEQLWKVLIADDEPIIREGIRGSVPWEKLGLTIAGEAEDGEEALEIALREKVDIALVDLNMPIMSGLVLIGKLREQHPSCKIIIITGHDEFGYAQEAIRLGVDDYLLKPVNPGQLLELLEKTAARLRADKQQEERMALASRQLEKNMDMLRERFCLEWIAGELSEEELREQLAFLDMPVRPPEAVGVIRWPEGSKGKQFLSEKDRQLLLFAIENIVEEVLASCRFIHYRDDFGMIVLLFWQQPDEEAWERIGTAVSDCLNIQVQARLAANTGGLTDVYKCYAEAKADVFKSAKLSPLIRRAKAAIAERYAEPELSLEAVAAELCVSSVYLSRLFKQETGVSYSTLLTEMRIKEAIRLLHDTDLSMNEIAQRIGYETQHYFSTAFKKATGVPPAHYRKVHT